MRLIKKGQNWLLVAILPDSTLIPINPTAVEDAESGIERAKLRFDGIE